MSKIKTLILPDNRELLLIDVPTLQWYKHYNGTFYEIIWHTWDDDVDGVTLPFKSSEEFEILGRLGMSPYTDNFDIDRENIIEIAKDQIIKIADNYLMILKLW